MDAVRRLYFVGSGKGRYSELGLFIAEQKEDDVDGDKDSAPPICPAPPLSFGDESSCNRSKKDLCELVSLWLIRGYLHKVTYTGVGGKHVYTVC